MMIYLDNAATTPVPSDVFQAMTPYLREQYANPSSLHSPARTVREEIEDVRDTLADWLGCENRELLFTSGGTESNNLAILGRACSVDVKDPHVICSSVEHKSVLRSIHQLEHQDFSVSTVPVGTDGQVVLDQLRAELRDHTVLISIMTANNETGTIQPIQEIAGMLEDHNAMFHTDAVQAGTYQSLIPVSESGVDAVTISGHKLHGPKGIGLLYIRNAMELQPRQFGGDHEFGYRAGTENVPGIMGLGKAVQKYQTMEEHAVWQEVASLRKAFLDRLRNTCEEMIVNTPLQRSVPHVLNVTFPGVEGETMVFLLDQEGICTSTGAACESDEPEPSHVLRAMGISREKARASVRFSFSRMNEQEEVIQAAESTAEVYDKARKLS